MDESVHRRLNYDALKWLVEEPGMDIQMLELSLAGLVLLNYLEINALDFDGPAFFEGGVDKGTGFSARASARVQQVANLLLEFRFTTSFDELCNRMKTRELRSSYFEGEAAGFFMRAGFEVLAKPETGVKREDFDFSATKGDVTINGEVTALSSTIYSPKTLESALKKKRSQLPDDKPAVIFCAVPHSWYEFADLRFSLFRQTFLFFRGSKRINAVVYFFEEWIELNDGNTAFYKSFLPITNQTARHPVDLSLFYSGNAPRFQRIDRLGNVRAHFEYEATPFELWFRDMMEMSKKLPPGWPNHKR